MAGEASTCSVYWPRKKPTGNVSLASFLPTVRVTLTLPIDVRDMEGLLPKLYADEAFEIPGARSLLKEIGDRQIPWAIVTSGTQPLVGGWLQRLSLPTPEHLITAESVENGKPDPACYLMGRQRIALAADDKSVLVLEDSPAGIRAGKAAGCKVLGLVTSHTAEQVASADPDWIVRDLDSVKIVGWQDGVATLEIRDGLVQEAPATNGHGVAA